MRNNELKMILKASANTTGCVNKPLNQNGPIGLELMKNVTVAKISDDGEGENVIHTGLFGKFLKLFIIALILNPTQLGKLCGKFRALLNIQ